MRTSAIKLLISLCLCVGASISASCEDKNTNIFIVPECDKQVYYCNEAGTLTLWLYTPNPEISGINELVPLSLEGNEFSYISKVATSQQFQKRKFKGKEYFAAPLGAYAIMIKDAGKYNIYGGEYKVGINTPEVVHDPFWGDVRIFQTSVVSVKAHNVPINIKSLPSNDNAESFSGAVGDYKVDVIIPKQDIIIGEPATVIIKIEGPGLIGDDTLPDYKSAFGDNIKLKSMNEKTDYYYDGNNIISQKILECEVIPTKRENCRIGAVRFGFFNPRTGQFEVKGSEPVVLDVKSSTVKIEPFSV